MENITDKIKALVMKYGDDTKTALRENPEVEYLYALGAMREDVLEWYEFRKDASLLQVGSDYGALTGLYGRRVGHVTVLDKDEDDLEVNRLRHGKAGNIDYVRGTLSQASETFGRAAFDYVVLVGSLKEPYAEEIAAAKALLKPGGVFILAVCNRLGLKYMAGAKPERTRLSRQEIKDLLAGDGELKFYYPMPDYRLAMTIYSDAYLPVKGDLTHAILAYDYPRYMRFDLGRMYDEVCEARQFETFANSFLVIWSGHEKD